MLQELDDGKALEQGYSICNMDSQSGQYHMVVSVL